ncbi:hypothetical protein [Dyella acidiphila]|uniref:Uncharacterized protein n=1 Tax=Dyella acidiphila TaxID=2775866 RepID=A0ABR9GBN1_9GAMM|nr:hypothetical protein [Dyella acidiphila]MBE1161409.1 hypothetical protein [Dyella acidiphila]
MFTLRGWVFLLAAGLLLPLHAQAAGLGSSDMEGVCLVKAFRIGVGGMRLPTWRPYLLLKDGSAYENPKLAPELIDPVQSRESEARRWGSWTAQGGDKALSMPGRNPMVSAQCLPPAAAGMSLQGSYKHVGGGGTAIAGGHASFMRSNTYQFSPDGSFSYSGSGGLISPGASTTANSARSGHYQVHDYAIDLRYDDGSQAQLFFYADGGKLLHIGDEDYVPAAE